MNKFLKDIKKSLNNPYATIASEGLFTDKRSFIDSGSYTINALVSGSIFGGVPSNSITTLAGKSSVGKTFFLLSIIKNFLSKNDKNMAFVFESESAYTSELLDSHNIPKDRILIIPVATVEDFRDQTFSVIQSYKDSDKNFNIFLGLDSLGNLSTVKELHDVEEGKRSSDLTRPKMIKSLFRTIAIESGANDIPLVLTNHTYDSMDMYSPQVVSGGSGVLYNSSTIINLSKTKVKDGSEVVGNSVKATALKSRLTKEHMSVQSKIDFSTGLDRYYGLLDLVIEGDIIPYTGRQFVVNDKKYFKKTIYENPEKFFTEEVLNKIDEYCKTKFQYGNH